ncbi:hypothetical protein N7532_005459 [Penicillium argentinense]|uniref:Tubulin-specific chaperone D n=1 Tax=Penicillium argentinense TaxID=1131581 RepID=A0A9W9K9Z3_9EURO|nr:uncharacterized protein N7532_005459 [Penicillium argentinense]KAJ5098458.1 hypothetical protein N7532_005459 [Penicillium argentinense]
MDAAEDRDIKLQRASNDLVTEFSTKLPSLLWRSQTGAPHRTSRKWTSEFKAEKLVSLLEPFQEWPQLLDPHLHKLLPPLVDAFLAYLINHRGHYCSQVAKNTRGASLYPLPRAICRLLYTFCKVRGVKVISRFLNNEPKYLESMLRAFIEWDESRASNSIEDLPECELQSMKWEERYVMLVWLSHLLLAPFDLSSLSSDDVPIPYDNLQQLGDFNTKTPAAAKSLLSLALHYINAPGKEREAATALLARLVLRGDMQTLGLLKDLQNWAFATILPSEDVDSPFVYSCIAKKTVVKILRNVTVMALSLSERGDTRITGDQLSSILEDSIDHFLVVLADKDTPVRFAASKALSVITLKLEPEMGAEVIEAVIDSLRENILYEKEDGSLVTPFEARKIGSHTLRRNLGAVDAQRWQGLMLTLSHLLFRRAPPVDQLPEILQSLVSGLGFEQRTATGSSMGTGVRDAACFGVWALSRKYTTSELQALPRQVVPSLSGTSDVDVLQKLAVELVCSACVDPSGNIRRGASAALQELIGRHPNTITEGIALVQVVDYHAVARRSRAMVDVSKATASLESMYWSPLLDALLQWRGIGSPDAESRRQAARSIGSLSVQQRYKTLSMVIGRLLQKLPRIPRSDVETRHGCFLSMAATVEAFTNTWELDAESSDTSEGNNVSSQVTKLWEVFESSLGPTDGDLTQQTSRPELTAEASACLIDSLARATISTSLPRPSGDLLDRVLRILSLCVSRGDDVSIETSSGALSTLFPLLTAQKQDITIQSWFSHLHAASKLPSGRGQILALGAVFEQVEETSDLRGDIITELIRYAGNEELIEKRVAAVRCLATKILPHTVVSTKIATNLLDYLNDYTTDRRGDIGSLVRVEAIQAAEIILKGESGVTSRSPMIQDLLRCLVRLASEKLDKVRLQAWRCLQSCWEYSDLPPLQRKYEHFSQVSSQDYFAQLLTLYPIDWLRLPLFKGLATSAVAGSEGLVRAARSALIQFLNSHEPNQRQTILVTLLQDLSAALGETLQDDRYAVPIVDFCAFLIDSFATSSLEQQDPVFRKVFVLVQKSHFRSSNIARLEAAIKAYAALSRLEALRTDVLKKLSGLLLHPFPRVRLSAADRLFVVTNSETVKYENWSDQPKQLKEKVEDLRVVLLPVS